MIVVIQPIFEIESFRKKRGKMFGWNKTSGKLDSDSTASEPLNLEFGDFDNFELPPGTDELTEEDLVNPELLVFRWFEFFKAIKKKTKEK